MEFRECPKVSGIEAGDCCKECEALFQLAKQSVQEGDFVHGLSLLLELDLVHPECETGKKAAFILRDCGQHVEPTEEMQLQVYFEKHTFEEWPTWL